MVRYTVSKNTVRCIITTQVPSYWTPVTETFIGVAKCSPRDTFDEAMGKDIAHKRALLKLKKYLLADAKDKMATHESSYNEYCKQLGIKLHVERQIDMLTEELNGIH